MASRNLLKMLGNKGKTRSLARVSGSGAAVDDLAIPGMQTISITFGDRAENHVGMQLIGNLAEHGFDLADLQGAKSKLESLGVACTLVPLHPNLPVEGYAGMEAWILIARNAVTSMLNLEGGTAASDPVNVPPVEVAAIRINEGLGACRDAIETEAGSAVDLAGLLRAAEQTLKLCTAITASADTSYKVDLFEQIEEGVACFEVVNGFRIAFVRRSKVVDPADTNAIALRATVQQALAAGPTGSSLTQLEQLERFSRVWSKKYDGIAKHVFAWEDLYHEQAEMDDEAETMPDEIAPATVAASASASASAAAAVLGSKKPNPQTADGLFAEQLALNCDKKAKMRGRVVNKHARWNVCFGEASQEPDYEGGKGRVVAFTSVPLLKGIRETVLPELLGDKANQLQGELNHYYDNRQCGIGFHGDSERKMVACLRLGATTPLHFQWFHEGLPTGERVKLNLRHGDFYVMSEKATGFDWKKRKIPTLRHAAGAEKFLKILKKKPKAPNESELCP